MKKDYTITIWNKDDKFICLPINTSYEKPTRVIMVDSLISGKIDYVFSSIRFINRTSEDRRKFIDYSKLVDLDEFDPFNLNLTRVQFEQDDNTKYEFEYDPITNLVYFEVHKEGGQYEEYSMLNNYGRTNLICDYLRITEGSSTLNVVSNTREPWYYWPHSQIKKIEAMINRYFGHDVVLISFSESIMIETSTGYDQVDKDFFGRGVQFMLKYGNILCPEKYKCGDLLVWPGREWSDPFHVVLKKELIKNLSDHHRYSTILVDSSFDCIRDLPGIELVELSF